MTLKDDKEGVIPLSKEMEEKLSIWYNNINLKIDLAKEIEEKDKEINRLNNIIDESLGIANERINYYNHKQIEAEDWSEIFNVLAKRDNQ